MIDARFDARRLVAGVAVAAIVAVTGCTSPKVSDSLYRSSEVGRSKQVVRCRVLEVREVAIRDDDSGEKGEAIGGLAGGLSGGIAGGTVGGGAGKGLATVGGATAGAVAGGAAGRALSDQLHTRKGIEYSIILADGTEQTHVQDFLNGDRVVQPGETCRLQISYDGKNRVLPAEQLPGAISAPKTTKIVP